VAEAACRWFYASETVEKGANGEFNGGLIVSVLPVQEPLAHQAIDIRRAKLNRPALSVKKSPHSHGARLIASGTLRDHHLETLCGS
jgi:hypothetical protein